MECVMKAGFKPETEEVCGGVVSVSGEDLFVDELLNLDDDESAAADGEGKEENGVVVGGVKDEAFEEKKGFLATPAQLETDRQKDVFGSVLSVPAEEADLEWLSQFVEESFSTFAAPFPTGFRPTSENPKPKPKPKPKPEPGSEAQKAHTFSQPGATAALNKARRSKRARTGCRVWSSVEEPSSPARESSPTLALVKRQRSREVVVGGPAARRCSHCGVQKTPQWQAGPMGAKTLCNACGVRYKSGRLLPEYRPACSPTFSSELHSNSHRKVLEMRRKKEMTTRAGQPEPSLAHPVPSFG